MLKAAVMLVLASGAAVLAGDKSAGCGKTPTITTKTYTVAVNGKQRQYHVKVPDSYDNGRPYKLIFTFHELSGSMDRVVKGGNGRGQPDAYYGLPPLANNSAIFVVPNGTGASNNLGWPNSGGEDVTFFDQMLKTVSNDLCVDLGLVFSTGFSYGGAISYALACARPDAVRAVAVLSSGTLSGCSGGTKPVAYYGQHGTNDDVLNVGGGRGMRDKFVKNNGCQPLSKEPAPNGDTSVKTQYTGCKEGYPVTWVIHSGKHDPIKKDQGSSTPFAPKNSWEFFSQFK